MTDFLLRSADPFRSGTCTVADAMLSVRDTTRPTRRSPQRGVTLIELLVVLAILLLIFAIAGVLVGPPLRKARLASAANEVEVLARRVPVEARTQRAGQGAFVFLKATPSTGTFELVADTNPAPAGDGVFQDPSGGGSVDTVIASVQAVRVSTDLVFHNLASPYNASWSNWSASGTSYVIGMDFQGRTVGANGRQIAGTAAVNLTDADMVSGAITPFVVHRLTFSPVWGVRQTRLVQDPAAASGWREY